MHLFIFKTKSIEIGFARSFIIRYHRSRIIQSESIVISFVYLFFVSVHRKCACVAKKMFPRFWCRSTWNSSNHWEMWFNVVQPDARVCGLMLQTNARGNKVRVDTILLNRVLRSFKWKSQENIKIHTRRTRFLSCQYPHYVIACTTCAPIGIIMHMRAYARRHICTCEERWRCRLDLETTRTDIRVLYIYIHIFFRLIAFQFIHCKL